VALTRLREGVRGTNNVERDVVPERLRNVLVGGYQSFGGTYRLQGVRDCLG
jgi:hypothetical protein